VDIPLKNVEKMTDVGGVFYLKYQFESKVQELRIKSSNVQGLYSTINTVLEMYREKNKPITEPVRPSEQEEFSFENTYLSDSFFEKMERDVEAEANADKPDDAPNGTAGKQVAEQKHVEPKPEPSKPVETPQIVEVHKSVDTSLSSTLQIVETHKPGETPQPETNQTDRTFQPRFEMPKPAVILASPQRKGWISGRRPVEEKPIPPPPSIKDAPTQSMPQESSPPQPTNQQDVLTIPTIVAPLETEPDFLEKQAQELMLMKTHQKSGEHLSLASEMDIDISNIRDSFINDIPTKQEVETNPIQKAGSDYSFSYNEGDSDVYGISDKDLHQILEENEDNEMFVKLRSASIKYNTASLEPTLEGDLSDSVCSSMTSSLIFKPDDSVSAGTSSMTSTYETQPVNDNAHLDSTPVATPTDGNNERLVVIKSISIPANNTNTPSVNNSNSLSQSPNKRDSALSVASTVSTKTSSRRNSFDYENIYSSITYDTLTPVGSVTTDALAHMEQARSESKSTLEAQAVLQSIEEFLDTEPVIGTLPPDAVITPRVFHPEEKPAEEPKVDLNMYASLDDLLRETEDLLKQTLHDE
jgi:hypothetical protein